MNGILLVNKETGLTSRDVVNRVCRILNTKKVGHTGTLDPLATGVMVLCVGSATKLVEVITANQKEYVAEVILGIQTDTGDITGNILEEKETHISLEQIQETCKKMQKTYEQTVPIYSAVKVKGKKLYEYARSGIHVELPSRQVTIYELECISTPIYEDGKTIFKIRTTVSKGTYIRSLIEDFAKELNAIGTMRFLIRTRQGSFSVEECNTLEQIEKKEFELLDVATVLMDYPKIIVDDYLETKIRNGVLLENRYTSDVVLFQNQKGVLLALYRIYEKDPNKMKPWKMLSI